MKQFIQVFCAVTILAMVGCNSGSSARKIQTSGNLQITGIGISTTDLALYQPATFTVTVLSSKALTHANIALGLMQKIQGDNATDTLELSSCPLGIVRIENIAANTPTSASAELAPSEACPILDGSGLYNIFAFIDPDQEIDETDEGEEDNNAIVYNRYELSDAPNQACISDTGETGCIYDITLTENKGIDLSISSLRLESDLFIVYPPTDSLTLTAGSNEHNFPPY